MDTLLINEMREFSNFTKREQWYIKIALTCAGLCPTSIDARWARTRDENVIFSAMVRHYTHIEEIKRKIPSDDFDQHTISVFMGLLYRMAQFDIVTYDHLECFSAFRYLYERLFGAEIRPWLPSVFAGVSALQAIKPQRRKILLQSISEAAATAPGWSLKQPIFFPEWIEKEV